MEQLVVTCSRYSWNVPNTASTQAIIRITDGNGITGESGIFTIKSNAGTIVILYPDSASVLTGGMQSYNIDFTATNTTAQKTLEYSLDGGLNWTLIGVMHSEAQSYSWALVPNIATTDALVRIVDSNGITGISGLFTITTVKNIGSINSLTLRGLDSKNNIGNDLPLEITWAFTPDIGTSVDVEYSLDNTDTWQQIDTVNVTESPNSTVWQTIDNGYYNPVFIKVTSSDGMSVTSIPFSIGSLPASVASEASQNGYSVSNYPNPATSQTTISFVLPEESDVTLTITDDLGREVGTIVKERFDAGSYNIPFNTSKLASGIYEYILQAGSTRIAGKLNIIN